MADDLDGFVTQVGRDVGALRSAVNYVTHEWVGEPHRSDSVKLAGGEEIARNVADDPSFELGLDHLHLGSAHDATRGGSPTFVGWGEWAVYTVLTGADNISTTYLRADVDVSGRSGYVAWAAGVAKRGNAALAAAPIWQVQTAGGWGSGVRGDFAALEWKSTGDPLSRQSHVIPIPVGAQTIRLGWCFSSSVDDYVAPPNGAEVWVDGWSESIASTEADAYSQARTYFDGDSPPGETRIDVLDARVAELEAALVALTESLQED